MKNKLTTVQKTGYGIFLFDLIEKIFIYSIVVYSFLEQKAVNLSIGNWHLINIDGNVDGNSYKLDSSIIAIVIALMCVAIIFTILLLVLKYIAIKHLHDNYSMTWPIVLIVLSLVTLSVWYLIPGIWGAIYNNNHVNKKDI